MRMLVFSTRDLRVLVLRHAFKELPASAWLRPSVWLALAQALWVCVPVYIETVPTRTP